MRRAALAGMPAGDLQLWPGCFTQLHPWPRCLACRWVPSSQATRSSCGAGRRRQASCWKRCRGHCPSPASPAAAGITAAGICPDKGRCGGEPEAAAASAAAPKRRRSRRPQSAGSARTPRQKREVAIRAARSRSSNRWPAITAAAAAGRLSMRARLAAPLQQTRVAVAVSGGEGGAGGDVVLRNCSTVAFSDLLGVID